MKKLLIFGGVIVVLFIALILLVDASSDDVTDDPLYDNEVTPSELETTLEEEEQVTVYFHSPECQYCLETTPVLVPLAEDMDVDLVLYNLLEYEQGWHNYGIDSTPTVVHFENGEEVNRIVGAAPEEEFESFLNHYALD
ncbi:thioredoxin family protein [Alkalibacillus haloalkaliphilus]|uniref:thioredoxin family protein n=1 Tax=Alkalibacillus haloalkaliphilus TaxID=94136 RepID=UPI00031ED8A4|nr:thioredoxin family protein [Alkalibacillus haloalkaliphilus]